MSPANGSTTKTRGDAAEIQGLSLGLAHHAPIAFYGKKTFTLSERSRAGSLLDPYEAIAPGPALRGVERAVLESLAHTGIHVLPRAVACERLPFEAQIATNLGRPPDRIFDAVLHWRD